MDFSGFIQGIINALAWLLSVVVTIIKYLIDGLAYEFKAILWYFIAGVVSTAAGFIKGINYSQVIFQFAAGYGGLPPTAIYVMSAIGLPQFVTIIASAYVVRFTLNLIPSWVTRA